MPQQQIDPNKPLTPQQVQQMQAQVGIKSGGQAPAPASQWGTYDKLIGKAPQTTSSSQRSPLGDVGIGAAKAATGILASGDVLNTMHKMTAGEPLDKNKIPEQLGAFDSLGAAHRIAGQSPNWTGVEPAAQPSTTPNFAGMTPEQQQTAMTPTNTAQKLGSIGVQAAAALSPMAVEVGPEMGSAAKSAASAIGDAGSSAVGAVGDVAKGAGNVARDAVTPMTPNMQTLIDRVKGDPEAAANLADQVKKFFKTAEEGKATTGAPTALDQAGGQFKTAMSKLRSNMKTAGETMSNSLAQVSGMKAGSVGDTLDFLKNETENRLGAQYAPMADTSSAMDGMSFAKRTQFLNDVIDGKQPNPFGEDGVFRSAPGREMTISSPSDFKKLADLHETLSNLGENPTVQQLHDTVQRIQSDLYKSKKPGAEPIDSNVQGLMKQVSGMLNEQAKTAATAAEKEAGLPEGQYTAAKSRYGDLAQLQEDMSRRLGKEFRQAPSLIKKIFSPQNQGLNPLIDKLEKETGVPIFDHATLADFVMRSVDDPRMRSLLEDAPQSMSRKAITAKVFEYITKKLADPEGKALRQLSGEPSLTDKVTDYAKNVQPGLSMKSSVPTPDTVAENMTIGDYKALKEYTSAAQGDKGVPVGVDTKMREVLDKHKVEPIKGGQKKPVFETDKARDAYVKELVDQYDESLNGKADTPKVTAAQAKENLATSGGDWDKAIQAGDIPKERIYKKDGTFTPEAADHVVSDLVGKLNLHQKGLGDAFKKAVDLAKPTRKSLVSQAQKMISSGSNQ